MPTEYTITFLLRLLPESPREAFAVWQITDEDFQPILGIILDRKEAHRSFGREIWLLQGTGGGAAEPEFPGRQFSGKIPDVFLFLVSPRQSSCLAEFSLSILHYLCACYEQAIYEQASHQRQTSKARLIHI